MPEKREGQWMFWAKREPARKATSEVQSAPPSNGSYHPLICHLVDVAAVARVMWDSFIPTAVRTRLARSLGLDHDEAGSWLAFWAGLHDLGKASPGFQGKWAEARAALSRAGLDFPVTTLAVPHGTVTAATVPALLEDLGLERETALRIAAALGGHHGVFPRFDDWLDLGPLHLGGPLWEAMRKDVHNALQGMLRPPSRRPRISGPAFDLLFAGLTCVADWIASMPEYFPYASDAPDPQEYAALSRRRARRALRELGWKRWQSCVPPNFKEVFGFPPNEMQSTVMALTEGLKGPSLIILEAPMGVGKTEVAWWLSGHLGASLAGTYVALPTEATSNQMYQRVQGFIEQQFRGRRVNLRLVHGHAAVCEGFRDIKVAGVSDDPMEGVVAEEWFTPRKRALLAPYAVGTVDQALLAVLRVKHGFLRLYGLASKTVIVDEAHAYDTYTSTLLDRLLAWLGAVGSPVVLLSATLPRRRRNELVNAYTGIRTTVPDAPYPRLTWVSNGRAACEPLPSGAPRKIEVEYLAPEEIPLYLLSTTARGGCAAWICNSVERAQQAYVSLRKHGNDGHDLYLRLFHARFPYEEREQIENDVVSRFGKTGSRPHRAILVATQVVEQSLDVDFDLLVTDPAPIDLVLQRAGRLHRHSRPRPPGMDRPRMVLSIPPERDGAPDFTGCAAVYDEYVMLRSWATLRGRHKIALPSEMDSLIEEVYGDSPLQTLEAALSRRLEEARLTLEKRRTREVEEAAARLIRGPSYQGNILETMTSELEEDDPEVHQAFQALTRLGGPSVEVICLHNGPHGPAIRPDGSEPVNSEAEPSFAMVERLWRRSVRLSHRGVVHYFLGQETPKGWRHSPFLRRCRCAVFTNGVCRVGNWELSLDAGLGLVIRRSPRT